MERRIRAVGGRLLESKHSLNVEWIVHGDVAVARKAS